MDKDGIHGFFTAFSRLIPAVVALIILLGIAVQYHVFDNTTVSVNPPVVKPSLKTGPFTDMFNISGGKSGLDPAKDFSCLYSDKTASISAKKKDNDIMIRYTTLQQKKYYLVKDDCLYAWIEGIYQGQKICGIGKDVSLIRTVLSTGLINIDSLAQALPENLPVASGSVIPVGQIQKILKSCVNGEVTDADISAVPKNVVFSEMKK